ncbi:MAG: homocysteine S-methyltransferase family protein [Planctomycetota bacterium]|jgi:5-methyltetrahydrofolate--homocysteine methyltransferase|nr:homocysteine S-methyltransferase family protein [Planctomycetota bacterium]
MNRQEFHSLAKRRPIILDGSTGTELVKRGLPAGACPEKWVLENPEAIRDLHQQYARAGSDFVLACTFGANRIKLADHGLAQATQEMNRDIVRLSRPVVGQTGILGDLSPTGQIIEPFGDFPFEEAVDVFREQATGLPAGGVDGFMIETMLDLQEARAALLAVRSLAPDLLVLVSLTYDQDGRTLTGTTPESAIVTLQSLGADAVGSNCSTGPREMLARVASALPYARVPILAKPNAGIPVLRDGQVEYPLSMEDFLAAMDKMAELGARVLGGCCGTTPEHIRQVAGRLKRENAYALPDPDQARPSLASARRVVHFSCPADPKPPLAVIGERINPTGKKAFQAELLAGDFSTLRRFAEEQTAAGADLLDVNLGLGGLDEAAALRQAVALLAPAIPTPLVLDSVNPAALEAGLRLYPGRALVNSVSGERERLERVLPLAAQYGAMLIVLPVGEGFIPDLPQERLAVTREIIKEATRYHYLPSDLLVDGLTMTVSSDPEAGAKTLAFLRLLEAEGLRSVIGLSNVSFGMPERSLLNAAFLTMAAAANLGAVIANPSVESIMAAKAAINALLGRRDGINSFISLHAVKRPAPPAEPHPAGKKTADPADLAAQAVLKGDIKTAAAAAQTALDQGLPAKTLVANHLVPAIMQAGDLFEKKEYFLPQLMLAGEAMRRALAVAEPFLARETEGGETRRGVVVLATVKGDVHDIGKNLVALMLRNHGFEVVDLGKDVEAAAMVQMAKTKQAGVVGLSALMTTTLTAMRQAVRSLKEEVAGIRVIVGGAAVTPAYAEEIGADGYSPDAVGAVHLAEKFTTSTGTNT